jgi:SEFIR domain
MAEKQMNPKAFISYSWTSESHRELVRNWADRLMADGVNIVLDQYDLKEGHDKYVFMEKMVTDPSVTHVLVICDKTYAEKADARKAGVGTESQIMSQEIYNKVEQSKFIPILCELSETDEPYLPTFIKSRIGINFSSPELVNDNWEQLVRLLFGKPLSATLEKFLELRSRPNEVTSWQDRWFEAHQLFVYETFLYIIAALLKVGAFKTIHEVFTSSYLRPESDRYNPDNRFVGIGAFWASSGAVSPPDGRRYLSPAAEIIKRNATRTDLPFESVIEAELLIFLGCALDEHSRWYPQTLFYAGYEKVFPFFIRASQHKYFKKLSIITGIETADELRIKTKQGLERMRTDQWTDFSFQANVSFWNAMNMDKLDTVK